MLHLHGRVGWYRREDGRVYGSATTTHHPGNGIPIVMLPDLEKDYGSQPIIQSIWTQFEAAVRRANRVLVLGHSLHDRALVNALKTNIVSPGHVMVTMLDDGGGTGRSRTARIVEDDIGGQMLPIRFGSPLTVEQAKRLDDWNVQTLPASTIPYESSWPTTSY